MRKAIDPDVERLYIEALANSQTDEPPDHQWLDVGSVGNQGGRYNIYSDGWR